MVSIVHIDSARLVEDLDRAVCTLPGQRRQAIERATPHGVARTSVRTTGAALSVGGLAPVAFATILILLPALDARAAETVARVSHLDHIFLGRETIGLSRATTGSE